MVLAFTSSVSWTPGNRADQYLCKPYSDKDSAQLTCALFSRYPKLARFNMTLTNLEYFYQDMGRLIDFNYDGMGPHFKLLEGFSISEFSEHIVEFMKVVCFYIFIFSVQAIVA